MNKPLVELDSEVHHSVVLGKRVYVGHRVRIDSGVRLCDDVCVRDGAWIQGSIDVGKGVVVDENILLRRSVYRGDFKKREMMDGESVVSLLWLERHGEYGRKNDTSDYLYLVYEGGER